MTPLERRTTWMAVACVVATGAGYGWLRYFGEGEDEFGPVAHPWLADLQAWHVLTAPLFVFALGLLWPKHVLAKLASGVRRRRRTGLLLLSQALLMTASGYALQVAVDEAWRTACTIAHVATSLLFVGLFAAHLAVGRVRPART